VRWLKGKSDKPGSGQPAAARREGDATAEAVIDYTGRLFGEARHMGMLVRARQPSLDDMYMFLICRESLYLFVHITRRLLTAAAVAPQRRQQLSDQIIGLCALYLYPPNEGVPAQQESYRTEIVEANRNRNRAYYQDVEETGDVAHQLHRLCMGYAGALAELCKVEPDVLIDLVVPRIETLQAWQFAIQAR